MFLAIAVDNISLTADEIEQVAEEEVARDEHMKEIHEKFVPSEQRYNVYTLNFVL